MLNYFAMRSTFRRVIGHFQYKCFHSAKRFVSGEHKYSGDGGLKGFFLLSSENYEPFLCTYYFVSTQTNTAALRTHYPLVCKQYYFSLFPSED